MCIRDRLQNQFHIGFSRMERVIRERMTLQSQDQSDITPQALINIRPVASSRKRSVAQAHLRHWVFLRIR